jgi:hypothetical protein
VWRAETVADNAILCCLTSQPLLSCFDRTWLFVAVWHSRQSPLAFNSTSSHGKHGSISKCVRIRIKRVLHPRFQLGLSFPQIVRYIIWRNLSQYSPFLDSSWINL